MCSAPSVSQRAMHSSLTSHYHSEAMHYYFPKAGNFPGKFWEVALGPHIENDSENIKSTLRVESAPESPVQMEKSQWEAGLQGRLLSFLG